MTAQRMHAEHQERESHPDGEREDPENEQERNAGEAAMIDEARIQRASRGCLEKWLCSRVQPDEMQDLYDNACAVVAAAEKVANVEMQIRRMKKPALVLLCQQLNIEGGATVAAMRDAVTQYHTQLGNNDPAQLLSQIEAANARAAEEKAAAAAAAAAERQSRAQAAQQAPPQAPAHTPPPPPTYGFSIDQLQSIALQNPLLFQQMVLAFQVGQNSSLPARQSEQAADQA